MSKKAALISAFLFIVLPLVLTIFVYSVLADGEIEIIGPKVHAGVGAKPKCGNNATSCGDPGRCVDLTGMVYCIRGRVVETRCSANVVRNWTTTTSCDGGSFRLRLISATGNSSSANITMYARDSSNIIGRSSINGEGSVDSLAVSADMNFDFRNSEFNFLIKGVDFTNFRDTTTEFIVDKVSATMSGTTVFKTLYVKLSQGFAFTTIILKIKYSDVSISESNITLYKCSDFNATSGTCSGNWQIIPIVKDSVNKLIIAEVDSFSAYALGDSGGTTTTTTTTVPPTTTTTTLPNQATTTTTTPPTTTTTISSSGSGGGTTTTTTTTTTAPTTTSSPTSSTDAEQTPETAESNTSADNQTQNQNENLETTQSTTAPTGFLSMVANYMPLILPVAAMSGTVAYNFLRKSDRTGRTYPSYKRPNYARHPRQKVYGKLKGSGKRFSKAGKRHETTLYL